MVLASPTATAEGSLLDKVGNGLSHYIYKHTPTYRVTLPSYPTCETKYQIGMA